MQFQIQVVSYYHYAIRGSIATLNEVSLKIDCSVRVETDLKRMGYCSEMFPLAFCFPELLCHAPYCITVT